MWSDWFTGWLARIPCEKFTECQAGLYQSENNNNKYAERGCGPTSPHPLFFFCMLPNQGNHFTLPTTNYQQKYTVQVNSRNMFKVRAFISFEGKTQIIYKSYLWKKTNLFSISDCRNSTSSFYEGTISKMVFTIIPIMEMVWNNKV